MSKQFENALVALRRAEDAIQHATDNFKLGILIVTANRCYYSAFYCMTALLQTQNIYAKTHQGAYAKFSELFVKTNIFPVYASDQIAFLFKYRQQADYDLDSELTEAEAETLLSKATEFLQLTKQYFDHLDADTKSSSQ